MTRPLFVVTSLLGLVCLVSGPVSAQQKVYQWKDASGRTHYSSSPPTSGKYTVRGAPTAPPPPAQAAAKTENMQCSQARGNLGILKGNANVRIDSDGDGKPDRLLGTEEHAAQVKLAESIIAVSCTATPQS